MGHHSSHPPSVLGYADRPVTKAPNWHGLVTLDILLNNLTTGLYLVTALGETVAPATFGSVTRLAYPLALLLLFGDLVCLVLDLGDPWRFHHMLRVWKPSSPMSLGTWCLTAYAVPLTVLVALGLVPGGTAGLEWIRQPLLLIGLVPALGAALYKGVLFSTTSQPGWRDARWLGGYLVNSAVLLGGMTVLGLAVLAGDDRLVGILRWAVAALLALNLVVFLLLVADLREALRQARSRRALAVLGLLTMLCSLVIPFILVVAGEPALMLGGVLLSVFGAGLVRFEIVRLPHLLHAPGPM
jgi:hypothetical protein